MLLLLYIHQKEEAREIGLASLGAPLRNALIGRAMELMRSRKQSMLRHFFCISETLFYAGWLPFRTPDSATPSLPRISLPCNGASSVRVSLAR